MRHSVGKARIYCGAGGFKLIAQLQVVAFLFYFFIVIFGWFAAMLAPQQRERGSRRDQWSGRIRETTDAAGAAALPEPETRALEGTSRRPADSGTARVRRRGAGRTHGPVRVHVRTVRCELRAGK